MLALALFAFCYLVLGVAAFALFGMDGHTLPSPISDAFTAKPLHVGAVVLYSLQVHAVTANAAASGFGV